MSKPILRLITSVIFLDVEKILLNFKFIVIFFLPNKFEVDVSSYMC